MRDLDRVRRLAARVARDRVVDWDQEERDAESDAVRDSVRDLRHIAAIAGFHRTVQAGDTSPDLMVSVSMARSVAAAALGTAAAHEPPELAAGSRWGHLEIIERVARGAFGEVYRARDTHLDRIVALKLLSRKSAASGDEVVREARLLAKVRHPHVVTVYGADRIDGLVGIWMEFLEGETLDRILRARGTLDAREAALVGVDLCRALSAVHAAGIVHQDIKLANVMRAKGGRIVLMDFGLGREARPRGALGKAREISGTPLFMAPEVLRGAVADVRSEVYSLGVLLFALATGTVPVEAATVSELRSKHERSEIRRARDLRDDLPEGFAHVVDRALLPDAKLRYSTPGEFERALLQVLGATVLAEPLRSGPRAARRWGVVALGVALAIATAFGIRDARRARPGAAPRTVPLLEYPAVTLVGEAAYGLFGGTVAGLGDVNQDGFDDVAVSAPGFDGERGKVYVYRGTSDGVEDTPSWAAVGTEDDEQMGFSLAVAKSILDGFPDLVVGSPGRGTGSGRVSIYAGSKDGLSKQPVQTFSTERKGTIFGYGIATGDVNHDGHDDLLIAEPYYPSQATMEGRVSLFLSNGTEFATTPAWAMTGPPGSGFGLRISLGGDVNRDGYVDAIIGAAAASCGTDMAECGAAYVYLGSATGLDSIPTILRGRQAGSRFGNACKIVGDLDGDGFADVAVGAEFAANREVDEGVLLVYFGSPDGIKPYGEVLLECNTMGANFGSHAGGLGDLDGDGCDELFVGALRYQRTQPREGAAFVFAGARDRRIANAWFRVRGRSGSWLGGGGASGDFNGDGFPDFIVASPSWDTETGNNVGQVEIFLNTRKR